jgi:Transposase, Mutator family
VNVRNGSRSKTVISDAVGEVRIDVPLDREGTFEPQIVKKRQRRLMPAIMPRLTSKTPNQAESATMQTSQFNDTSRPPATASPFAAAIVGFAL